MGQISAKTACHSALPPWRRVLTRAAAFQDRIIATTVLCCLLALSACGQSTALGQVGQDQADAGQANGAAGPEQDLNELYVLDSDDTVSVTVYKHQDLSGEFVIGTEGRISLPLIGEVDAAGKTSLALAEAIEERFADGYLRNPQVSVQISKYRPFYIFGSVRKPGDYAYQNNMTVLSAIAIAGGYEDDAVQGSNVMIIRSTGRNRTPEVVGLTARVYPGDIVEVPSAGTITVPGR